MSPGSFLEMQSLRRPPPAPDQLKQHLRGGLRSGKRWSTAQKPGGPNIPVGPLFIIMVKNATSVAGDDLLLNLKRHPGPQILATLTYL